MKGDKSIEETEWHTKLEDREKFIKNHSKGKGREVGLKEFEYVCKLDEKWAKMKDIDFPLGYIWISNHFHKMRKYSAIDGMNGSHIFTTRTILDYQECLGVSFTYYEADLLLKMYEWSCEGAAEAKGN